EIIGTEDFIEVYINAPLAICEERDVKGLYKKARSGEIKDFTGIDSPFEAPEHPELEIRTDEQNIEQSVQLILDYLTPILSQVD
ncbi:MAG TPA: adenylyl-sulfate kinase, partial [Flavobacteriales bacterium]|nr:adenylyl-sulfate kinase [Flavobacteriales bacterium]